MPGQEHNHSAVEKFHDFAGTRMKLIITGQHETKGLAGPICEQDIATGDLAIEIDVGFFEDGHICKFIFRHDAAPRVSN